jgi:DNA sulfur modification protein DndE
MTAIDHVRLSQQAKDQLIKLKRVTGIEHWNILCRWALCVSLAEKSVPPSAKIPADSNVEMSWRVFAGRYADVYLALMKQRCLADKLPINSENLARQFRLHLHRGIAYLAAKKNLRKIDDLIELAL